MAESNDRYRGSVDIDRSEWDGITAAFVAFFAGAAGSVLHDDHQLEFDGRPDVATGLVIRRDGTSESFMPLHGLQARWTRIRFDTAADAVVLEGDGVTYTYRVPPALRTQNPR